MMKAQVKRVELGCLLVIVPYSRMENAGSDANGAATAA